jgi:hypothetical protein
MQYFIFFDNFFKMKVDALVQDREYLKIQKILTKKFTWVKEAFSLELFFFKILMAYKRNYNLSDN